MQSNLVQISNIFNLMVQADSSLEFYHFGWRSDINRNIDNNFDQGTIVGRLFPSVQFEPPEKLKHSNNGLSYLGVKEDVNITLYFDDLQDYNNDSSAKVDTLIEQWTNLKQLAENFVLNLEQVLLYKYKVGFIASDVSYIPRSNLHNDKLITWEVNFSISHTMPCTLEENILDLSDLPDTLRDFDLENYLKGFDNKTSFELNGVNQYIKAPTTSTLNLEWSDTFSYEFWTYSEGTTITALISKWYDQTGLYLFVTGSGTIGFQFRAGAFIAGRCLSIGTNTGVFPFNQWNHVVLTNNGGGVASSIKLYINNVLIPFTNVVLPSISAPFSIKQTTKPLEFGASTYFAWYTTGKTNTIRLWDLVLTAGDVNSLYDNGCPTFPVQESNFLWSMLPDSSPWNGSSFDIVDESGTQADFDSVLLVEASKVEETPCG